VHRELGAQHPRRAPSRARARAASAPPAHQGVPDPAAFEGGEAETLAAFDRACEVLAHRVARLGALPLDALEGDPEALRRALEAIGRSLPEDGSDARAVEPPRGGGG
jgi:hypothetical protein